jgi:16S rRNA pseudouridine516 synthase
MFVTVMMNKPAGVLSATEDGRDKTAADLLSGRYAFMDLKPAGRLDKDAVGLLLMTNDGALIHGIISPNRHVPKRYFVELDRPLPEGAAESFAAGVVLEDGYRCLGAELIYEPGETRAETVVYEGKFHQVKRMFSVLGSRVRYLKRVSVGPLVLDGDLPEGGYRELTEGETRSIYEAAGLPMPE